MNTFFWTAKNSFTVNILASSFEVNSFWLAYFITRRAVASTSSSAPRGPTNDRPIGQPSSVPSGRLACGSPASPAMHSRLIARMRKSSTAEQEFSSLIRDGLRNFRMCMAEAADRHTAEGI